MKCLNDPSRSYTGTEPSAKGLGYCAHAEKLGTIRRGKDGKLWQVTKTKSGIKRWSRKNDGKNSKYEDCVRKVKAKQSAWCKKNKYPRKKDPKGKQCYSIFLCNYDLSNLYFVISFCSLSFCRIVIDVLFT